MHFWTIPPARDLDMIARRRRRLDCVFGSGGVEWDLLTWIVDTLLVLECCLCVVEMDVDAWMEGHDVVVVLMVEIVVFVVDVVVDNDDSSGGVVSNDDEDNGSGSGTRGGGANDIDDENDTGGAIED